MIKRLFLLMLFSGLFVPSLQAGFWFLEEKNYPKDYFRPPLNIPLILSGTFCELRTNHFHAGIDIKTKGTSGYRVYSIADGYVSRVKVSPRGYGLALYVDHPNGYTSVYGHLSKFNDAIAKYVKEQQYAKESFEVDLYPPANLLNVKKGEKIALSGNTGSSQGPHLHFEIRETATEFPVNPLLFGMPVKDQIQPTIKKMAVYPIRSDDQAGPAQKYSTTGINGQYKVKDKTTITVNSDRAGVGIYTWDLLNGAANHNGVYSISLRDNDQLIYAFEMEKISFDEMRYLNSHIDYAMKIDDKIRMQKCFKDVGNKLSIYKDLVKAGIINLSDGEIHKISIDVKDVAGNVSNLSFNLKKANTISEIPLPQNYTQLFAHDSANDFENNWLKLHFEEGSFYTDQYFKYEMDEVVKDGRYSFLHQVHHGQTPLHKAFEIALKPFNLPAELKEKALLAYTNIFGRKRAVSSHWEADWLVGLSKAFGHYYITTDTQAPKIQAINISNNKNMAKNSAITCKISDNLSGVKSYRGTIDDQWVLMEYDGKSGKLSYIFDERVNKGKHVFNLVVTDACGNEKSYQANFTR